MKVNDITEQIIGAAYKVFNTLGSGFLEKVYHNALLLELDECCLDVKSEFPIKVRYNGLIVGDFVADIIVEDCVIVELKAVETLQKIHEVQLVNYLAGTEIDDGLLINFGSKIEIKRKFRKYQKTE